MSIITLVVDVGLFSFGRNLQAMPNKPTTERSRTPTAWAESSNRDFRVFVFCKVHVANACDLFLLNFAVYTSCGPIENLCFQAAS